MNPAEMQRHQATWALLPWLANGSATPAQRRQAEAHLATCADCREALRHEQQLVTEMAEPATPGPDLEQGLAKLMRRLDGANLGAMRPAVAARPRQGWMGGWAAAAQSGLRVPLATVALVGGLQLVLTLGVVAWWWQGQAATATPAYQTLTDAPAGTGASRGVLRVVFQGERRVDEVQALLLQRGLVVLAGPTEAGVFTLGWAEGAGQRDADGLAAELRHLPAVAFAESTGPAR
ncbi:zf-HC2 domain-containing protein [Ideonella azotifigens]|uniref:Putative zinc-finger domain-containing protein n=2 Tax=Ideonella azotifigens TaxID=513160 RepID=A0ABN1KDK2_9BURK|nr:zf-HC2 domain-containing protein [Ideonella azotifigens]MCD2342082.1 zf-HC2 domain-containing protein [Ideonella azotifigens]